MVVPESHERLSLHLLSLKWQHSLYSWIWWVHFSRHSAGYLYRSKTPLLAARHNWLLLWGSEHLSLMGTRGRWRQIDGSDLSRGFFVLLRLCQSFRSSSPGIDLLEWPLLGRRPWVTPMILKAWHGGYLRTYFERLILTRTILGRLLMSLRHSTREIWWWLSTITDL